MLFVDYSLFLYSNEKGYGLTPLIGTVGRAIIAGYL